MSVEQVSPASAGTTSGVRATTLRAALLVIGLLIGVSLLLWPTMVSLHREWVDTAHLTFIHGYLVVALVAWLLWRVASAAEFPIRGDRRALLPLAALMLAWLIGVRSGLEMVHQALWPAVLLFAICAAAGWQAAQRCAFALGILYFAIPLWTVLDGALQSLSAKAVELMLRVTNVPSFVDGTVVHIPEGVFVIEGGCNGMHFLIVALAIAGVFGELHRDRWPTRAWQMALAGGLALFANWVRIYVVVLAGHLTDMQHYLVSVSHYYFGWGVFAVFIGLFLWIASRSPLPARALPRVSVPGDPAARTSMNLALTLLLVAAVTFLGALSVRPAPRPVGPVLPSVEGWTGPLSTNSYWQPHFANHDRSALAVYRRANADVQAFIVEYDQQRQGKELVGYGNSLTQGLDGPVLQDVVVPVAGGDARLLLVDSGGDRSVILYYYEVGKTRRVAGLASQLTYGLASLVSAPRSSLVSVRARCAASCDAAAAQARQLLDALGQARARRNP